MTYKICYWDADAGEQRERDSTPDEDAQRERDIAAAAFVPVPIEVTSRQALQALYIRKRITEDMIQAQVDAIQDPDQRYLASVELRKSHVFERARPLVATIGSALAMSSAEMDDLFRFAATL